MEHTRGYGHDVFEHRSVLCAVDIVGDAGLDEVARDETCVFAGEVDILACHGEVGEPLEGDLLGVTRAANDTYSVDRDAHDLIEPRADNHIAIGDETLDGGYDVFVGERLCEVGEYGLHEGGGDDDKENIAVAHDGVDVVGERDLAYVELDAREI